VSAEVEKDNLAQIDYAAHKVVFKRPGPYRSEVCIRHLAGGY
jgi:hypothetical protein